MPDTEKFLQPALVPLEVPIPLPGNPKDHDLGEMHVSIAKHGFVERIVISKQTSHILSGHGRIAALRQSKASGEKPPRGVDVSETGSWLIPSDFLDCDPEDEEEIALALNELVIRGGYKQDLLAEALARIIARKGDEGLRGTGFDRDRADALLVYLNQMNAAREGGAPQGQEPENLPEYEEPETAWRVIVTCADEGEYAAVLEALGIEAKIDGGKPKITFPFADTHLSG